MTRRANVVECSIECDNTSFTHVADLEASLATLMGSSNRAAATAEVAFSALCGGGLETRGTAVVAGSAGCAFGDVGETDAVTVRAIGAQKLSGEARASRAIAASDAIHGSGCIIQAEGS